MNLIFDWDDFEDRNIKFKLVMYFADKSIREKHEGRKVYEGKINYSEISREVDMNRKAVKTAVDYLLENTDIIYYDEDKLIFNEERKGFGVALPIKTIRRMYKEFSDYSCKIFFYLYRQFKYWTDIRECKAYEFSLGGLCKAIGLTDHDKNRRVVQECLDQLVENNLIEFNIKKKGATYYRCLFNVVTKLGI